MPDLIDLRSEKLRARRKFRKSLRGSNRSDIREQLKDVRSAPTPTKPEAFDKARVLQAALQRRATDFSPNKSQRKFLSQGRDLRSQIARLGTRIGPIDQGPQSSRRDMLMAKRGRLINRFEKMQPRRKRLSRKRRGEQVKPDLYS